MASNLRGYTPFELFNKVLNTDNDALQVDIVDATGVTVTVDSEFPAADVLADNAANPNTTSVQSFLMGYDSGNTNWNRVEVDDDGNLQVDVVSTPGDDSIVTLGSSTTYTENSSKGTIIGGVRNDVLAALADTDNEFAPLQVNSSGALYIDVADGGTLEVLVDGIETLLGTIDSDTNDIKTATELIGTAVGTDGSTGPAKVVSVGGTDGSGNVQEIAVDSSGNVQVDLVSAAVTNAGTFAVQADLGSNNDIKIESGQVKSGAIASGAVASGAFASGSIASGAIASGAIASGALASGSIASGALAAGAVAAGATSFVALENSDFQAGDAGVKVLAKRKGTPADSSGSDGDYEFIQMDNGRVWTSTTVESLPASTNTIEIVGDAAENDPAAGNPVLSGGRYDSPGNDNATVRSLDDNDVGALALDPTGALYVREYLGQTGSCFVSGTAAVTAAIGKFVAIQFLEDTVFNGTDGLVATDSGRWPDDTDAATDISSSNTAAVGSQVFPQGMTIFGRWDSFILVSGAVIAYVGNV